MKNTILEAEELCDAVSMAVSPYHVVAMAEEKLQYKGYERLNLEQSWSIEKGKGYYTKAYDSTLLAFRVNPGFLPENGFRIAAAHTDWPCFCIKPQAGMAAGKYAKVNVEVYGGPILNTWLDRPLSVAGRVTLTGEDAFSPVTRLIDFERSILTIPNLAIHMNREVNKGVELNRQRDMLPVMGMIEERLNQDNYFLTLLAEEAGVKPEEILYYELYVYNRDRAEYVGIDEEFISSPRLDNMTSVQACINGLLSSGRNEGIDVSVLFDNEEIGSDTKQGAASMLMPVLLERIMTACGYSREDYLTAVFNSFLLSADVAHACHPNHPEKADPTSKVYLNGGVVIKTSAVQRYATDGTAIGVIAGLCRENHIPFQMFANRSDMAGGSTLGSIASVFTAMKTADVGIPLLAMHSSRELMGTKDQAALSSLIEAFFGGNDEQPKEEFGDFTIEN